MDASAGSPSQLTSAASATDTLHDGRSAERTTRPAVSEGELPLFDAATAIVAAGSDPRDASLARDAVRRGSPFSDAEELLIMEQALIIVMWENACDAEQAAALIRTGARNGLDVIDVALTIVELGVVRTVAPTH